jgi:hypothetical protein
VTGTASVRRGLFDVVDHDNLDRRLAGFELEPEFAVQGNGHGEKFRNLNVEDSGGGAADDVTAGAQYLVDRGLADPKRLGIGGGSHRGTMVAYMVTKYPAPFQAAIEMYGVVDRASFNKRTNRNCAIRRQMKMGGGPAEQPELGASSTSTDDLLLTALPRPAQEKQ